MYVQRGFTQLYRSTQHLHVLNVGKISHCECAYISVYGKYIFVPKCNIVPLSGSRIITPFNTKYTIENASYTNYGGVIATILCKPSFNQYISD